MSAGESFLIGEYNSFTGEWEKVYGIADSELAAQEWVRANVTGWETGPKLALIKFQTITRRAPLAHGGVGVADSAVPMQDHAYEAEVAECVTD